MEENIVVASCSSLNYLLINQSQVQVQGKSDKDLGHQGWRNQQKVRRRRIDIPAHLLQPDSVLHQEHGSLHDKSIANIALR